MINLFDLDKIEQAHKVVEYLEDACYLISDHKRWTKYLSGRDRSGNPTDPSKDKAISCCSHGALMVVYNYHNASISEPSYNSCGIFLRQAIKRDSFIDFNDHATHPQVVRMFDTAIQLAKSCMLLTVLEQF